MKNLKKFKPFQIRWKEPLGDPKCPYLYRWTFIFANYSLRIHHWIKSDDRRHAHDHACDLISIVIKGWYYNVIYDKTNNSAAYLAKPFKPRFMKAKTRHHLEIPEEGAWTVLLCGRPYHKWGFYVRNKETKEFVKWRPLRYFSKFGIIQSGDYQ